MRNLIHHLNVQTHHETELINITETVDELVTASGIQSGLVLVLSLHTTTGITVNENLHDLETDITEMAARLVPENATYHHARYLPSDGQMAVNAPSHLRGALLGFQVFFPIEDGQMLNGSRQTIYFVELDGPQLRHYVVQCMGE